MREYYKEKIKNLVALRTNLFAVTIVLTGGVFGLFFMEINTAKLLFFFMLGGYFDILFLKNLFYINNCIEKCVEELK